MDTKLMIFDLDGTLLDTIGDLAACCDHVLAARGLPLHTYEEYCGFVGNGVMRLVERALPEELRTPETVAAVRADFVAYYTEHIDRFTRPYEGIPELLRELVQRGVRLAVASNKFQIGTEKLVRIYFPSIRFDAVFGQRPGVPLKPDPQVVREILADTDAESGAVLYAGPDGHLRLQQFFSHTQPAGFEALFRKHLKPDSGGRQSAGCQCPNGARSFSQCPADGDFVFPAGEAFHYSSFTS